MGQLYMIPDRNRMEESLELAKDYHAAFEYNDFFPPVVLDDKKKIQELIAYLNENGITYFDWLIRQASEHRIRQSMDIAREMGLRGVVFHTGRLHGFRDKIYLENWLKVNEEFFREILQKYPKQHIFMENMFDEAPDILAQLAKRFCDEPRFGVCLDYAHAAITNIREEEWVKALAPYIRHMHINDNDKINDLHQEIGTGQLDWCAFDSEMRRFGVDSGVLIEMKDLGRQRCSMEYLKKNNLYPFAEQTN